MFHWFRRYADRKGRGIAWQLALLLGAAASMSAQHTTPHCVCLKWTSPGDDGNVGTASVYDVRYSTSYLTKESWDTADSLLYSPKPKPAGSEQQVCVTRLESGTTYYFAIKAVDEHLNWSAISNVVTVATPKDSCIGTVGNVDCDPDENVTIQDLVVLVDYLFVRGPLPCICLDEADIHPSPDGRVNVSDLTNLVQYLFFSSVTLPPCQ